MVLPPNRIGAIRGPDERTITDLYDQLTVANALLNAQGSALAAMVSNLEFIANRIGLLAGNPADAPSGWFGLPLYLHESVAIAALEPEVPRIQILAQQQAQRLNSLMMALFATFTPTSGTRWQDLYNRIDDIGADVQEGVGLSTSLLEALGSLNSPPVGINVKAILMGMAADAKRSADCCEEQGSYNPDPPSAGCGPGASEEWLEATVMDVTDPSGYTGGSLYRVVWPAEVATWAAPVIPANLPDGNRPHLINSSTELTLEASVCLAWDTNYEGPAFKLLYQMGEAIGYTVGANGASTTTPAGSQLVSGCTLGDGTPYGRFWYAEFELEDHTGPFPGKVWVSANSAWSTGCGGT